jgi:hypothetical protein
MKDLNGMSFNLKLTGFQWNEIYRRFTNRCLYDIDGWDRKYNSYYDELIDIDEFKKRLSNCTTISNDFK